MHPRPMAETSNGPMLRFSMGESLVTLSGRKGLGGAASRLGGGPNGKFAVPGDDHLAVAQRNVLQASGLQPGDRPVGGFGLLMIGSVVRHDGLRDQAEPF